MPFDGKKYTNPGWDTGAALNQTNMHDISAILRDLSIEIGADKENMLINSNFNNAINQTGVKTFGATFNPIDYREFVTAPLIDGWSYSTTGSVEYDGESIHVTTLDSSSDIFETNVKNNCFIIQSIPKEEIKKFCGRKVCASVLAKANSGFEKNYIDVFLVGQVFGNPDILQFGKTRREFDTYGNIKESTLWIKLPDSLTSLHLVISIRNLDINIYAASLCYNNAAFNYFVVGENVTVLIPPVSDKLELLKCQARRIVAYEGVMGTTSDSSQLGLCVIQRGSNESSEAYGIISSSVPLRRFNQGETDSSNQLWYGCLCKNNGCFINGVMNDTFNIENVEQSRFSFSTTSFVMIFPISKRSDEDRGSNIGTIICVSDNSYFVIYNEVFFDLKKSISTLYPG